MKLGAIVLGLLGLLGSSTVHAEAYEFSRVVLVSSGCKVVGLGDAELRAALAPELSASSLALAPVGQASASTDVTVSVRAPCTAREELVLIASWNDTRFARSVKLDELPRASRARALALVVAELVAQFATAESRAGDAPPAPTGTPPSTATSNPTPEVVVLPETPAAPNAAPAKDKAAQDKAGSPSPAPHPDKHGPESGPLHDGHGAATERGRTDSTVHLGGALELRSFFSGPSLFGGRLQLDWDIFAIGLSGVGGDRTVPAGVLSAFIVHGTGAVRAVRLDTSLHTSLSMGPRIGVGYLTVSARSTSASVEARADSEPYVDGAAFAAFSFQPSPSVRLGAAAELGYARGVVALADGADVGYYGGLFASALLELAFQL